MKKTLTLHQEKPCRCGGRLVLMGAPRRGERLRHLALKCQKCGEWYGGYTYKDKKEES